MLIVRLFNVEDEDVVCIIYTFTFKGKSSTWYFSRVVGSFHSCNNFQNDFLGQFGEDKTPTNFVLELSIIKMGPKGKRFFFFFGLRNKIPKNSR